MKTILFAFFIACAALPANSFAQSAAVGTPPVLLTSDIDVPHPPTPPTPPSVTNLRKERPAERQGPDKNFPAPFKQQESKPISQPPQKTTQAPDAEKTTGQAAEKQPAQTKKSAEETSLQKILQEDFPEKQNAEKNTAHETERKTTSPAWPQKIGYTVAMAVLIGLTAYLYTTTPQVSQKAKPRRTFSPEKHSPKNIEKRKEQPPLLVKQPHPLRGAEPKIKNTSLLEQLVKYDMETYGQLRSNLDYEQPAYVERLIRKYGNGDQGKINRAINAFYQNRQKNK